MKHKEILITGGTGSLGTALTNLLLSKYKPKGIRIYSRDELKQWQMKRSLRIKYGNQIPISFLIGDIRDYERLKMATKGVTLIIHCCALKQVPSCEYNPIEAIKTNIKGAENVVRAALENNVEKVMNISTDKAVYPINLYGMTKAVAEKLFTQANVYAGDRQKPMFASCRYGNVIGSRGSIFPLFAKQIKEQGFITITHKEMTRFFITLKRVAEFVIDRIGDMKPGEIYIPKMPSAHIIMIAEEFVKMNGGVLFSPGAVNDLISEEYHNIVDNKKHIKEIGVRPGEKIHETLITKEEGKRVFHDGVFGHYTIAQEENVKHPIFGYQSDTNPEWLSAKDIREIINGIGQKKKTKCIEGTGIKNPKGFLNFENKKD